MRFKMLFIALLFAFVSQSALAQLEPYTDYDISGELWNITFIKVDPNMGDDYLEGLKETWVASNKVAKELKNFSFLIKINTCSYCLRIQ